MLYIKNKQINCSVGKVVYRMNNFLCDLGILNNLEDVLNNNLEWFIIIKKYLLNSYKLCLDI